MTWPCHSLASAVDQALTFEKTMAKIRAVLGSTETPPWVLTELNARQREHSIPVPDDGLPDRHLRRPYPLEAADMVLGAILAGDLPEGCTCTGHEHRPDVFEPRACVTDGCGCWSWR